MLGQVEGLRAVLAAHPVDEVIVTDSDYSERELLQIVEHAHRSGVKVRIAPKTTELLVQRGEYVPGQGLPLFELRPPVFAGTDWAVKRTFDLVVSALVVCWSGCRSGSRSPPRSSSPRAGPVFYRDPRVGLGERDVPDVQVPDDVRGRGRAAGRARAARTRRTARSSRSATTRA